MENLPQHKWESFVIVLKMKSLNNSNLKLIASLIRFETVLERHFVDRVIFLALNIEWTRITMLPLTRKDITPSSCVNKFQSLVA